MYAVSMTVHNIWHEATFAVLHAENCTRHNLAHVSDQCCTRAALEAAGDAIKEVGQKFADAQKMPDLGSMDELTKDGAFYTVKNDNPLVKDTTARNLADGKAADIPFGETGSKGSKPGSDSTKPSVAENVEKVVKNITGQE